MLHDDSLLQVENLKMYFPVRRGLFRKVVGQVKAVDGVSFTIKNGETLGLVGESGCGKTTTGRCIVRLLDATDGAISFRTDGQMTDIAKCSKQEMIAIRRQVQIIFQDPFSSLDPRMSVRDIIAEPLQTHRIGSRREQTDQISTLLQRVGLGAYQMNRYPHEFSGGQRQRIGIARALALSPKLIVCDEPVSALDVSIQAQVLNLLSELQQEYNLTYLFIAHDLSVVEHISDRVLVMYLGKIVEAALADRLYQVPKHPYSEALLAAIPVGDPRSAKKRIPLKGTVPDPSNPPPGCNFKTRCPYAVDECHQSEPELRQLLQGQDQFVACHFADELQLKGYEV